MDNVFANVVGAIIGLLLVSVLRQREKIADLKSEKELLELSSKRWENTYRNQIFLLQGQIDKLLKMKTSHNSNVPPDTIKAVKYAMKHAHPDNGGNAEDFMKFKKCYEELTNRKG